MEIMAPTNHEDKTRKYEKILMGLVVPSFLAPIGVLSGYLLLDLPAQGMSQGEAGWDAAMLATVFMIVSLPLTLLINVHLLFKDYEDTSIYFWQGIIPLPVYALITAIVVRSMF